MGRIWAVSYWYSTARHSSIAVRSAAGIYLANQPCKREMATMKIAATELMAETTNSDGSFQGFSLRDLSLSLFLALPFLLLPPSDPSLPPYARLSCPEHEGRFPLTLMAAAAASSERTRTDMDARARGRSGRGHRRSGTGIGRWASLPPSLVASSTRPSDKTLRIRPKFLVDRPFFLGLRN